MRPKERAASFYQKMARSAIHLVLIIVMSQSGKGLSETDFETTIRLKSRTISPQEGVSSQLLQQIADAARYPIYGIIQLKHRPLVEDRRNLELAGIKLLEYLGGTAYYASFDKDIKFESLEKQVRWAGPLLKEDKIDPALMRGEVRDWAKTETGEIKVIISFFEDVSPTEAEDVVSRHTTIHRRFGPSNQWSAQISLDAICKLAAEIPVRWIEQGPHPMMPLGEDG
jgi:hypothetical protein